MRRREWVDVLRAVLVLAVITYHVRNGVVAEGGRVPEWVDDVMRTMEPVRMPVLMILSGLFLPRGLEKGWRRYAVGKSSALVAPYVAWSLLFYFVLLADIRSPGDQWWRELLVPHTPLWFLLYLIAYFALALPLRTPSLRVAGLVAVLAWIELGGADTDFHFVFYLACFLTGAVVADHAHRVVGLPRHVLTVAAVGPLLWGVDEVLDREFSVRTPFWILVALAALLVLRAAAISITDTRVGRWLATIGPMTVVLFLVHAAVHAVAPDPFGSYWATLALTMGITVAAAEVVKRDERWWLLFEPRRGWRAVTSATSAQAVAHVQPDLRVDHDLLRGGHAVRQELGVDWRTALEQRERDRP